MLREDDLTLGETKQFGEGRVVNAHRQANAIPLNPFSVGFCL